MESAVMQGWEKDDSSDYQNFLHHQFSSAAADSGESPPSNPLLADMVNRQEILFMQFEMTKRGKSLGMEQWRLIRLEEGRLVQTDGKEDKQLPMPSSITVTRKIDDDREWVDRQALFEAKMLLTFKERSEVTVYFRSVVECREISMFLLAQKRMKDKKSFEELAALFKGKVAEAVTAKIQSVRQEGRSFRNARLRAKVGEACRKALTDRAVITHFLETWKSKAHFRSTPLSFGLRLREMRLKTESFTGVVKFWAQGKVNKQVTIVQDNTSVISETGRTVLKLSDEFSDQYMEISAQDELQVEVELGSGTWKTERFTACDAWRVAATHRNIELALVGKGEQGYLRLTLLFPTHSLQPNPKITPHYYRIIDQIYNPTGAGFELANIHQHFKSLLVRQREEETIGVSWSRGRQLLQAVKGEELIQKFYSVEPFKAAEGVTHRGTYVYAYFLKDQGRELYYQVEKLMWRHPNSPIRSLLTALKVFDQNLKFMFTDGLYHLVASLYSIAQRESTGRWKEALFERSVKGVQSLAFLLAVGFLKAFPGVLVHQEVVSKRALPVNSLLFVWVLRRHAGELADKLAVLQLNIEAYFGIHFVSLLSSLFRDDTLSQLLILLLNERRQQPQSLLLPTLIGAFLAAMQLTDRLSSAYASAEHYMVAFEETSRNPSDKAFFWIKVEQWRGKVGEAAVSSEWAALSEQVNEFYLKHAYGGQLGEVAQQIYQEFTCYHYKDEHELRKLLLMVDRIEVGADVPALTLAIFQAGLKLYQHDFKGVPLSQLAHFIQLRLLRLEELTIVCTTEKDCFLCRIDPKEVPSNLYFHLARTLLPSRPLPEANRHILLQAYIKDSCEVQALQNPIPDKYRQMILEGGVSRQQVLFCRKYSRTFRMRESNFNLLYSKLGWLGGHYLVPHDRLIDLHLIAPHPQPPSSRLLTRIALLNRYTRTLYGKALAPYPSGEVGRLCAEMIKEGIRTEYQGTLPSLKSSLSEASTYNSASRLASYALDNFNVGNSHFLEFYYRMAQLPLIHYLAYRPRQFFLLPTFTLQVATPASVCTVVFSQKGLPFRMYTPDEVRQIQGVAMGYTRLPSEVEFGYPQGTIYFDDFLGQLRANLLRRVVEVGQKEEGRKSRPWGASLACTSFPVPNYRLRCFFQAMNETKQIVQLHFRDQKAITGVEYEDFGLIGGKWVSVHCLGVTNREDGRCFVVLQELTRRKHLLRENDLIRTQAREERQLRSEQDVDESLNAK